MYNILVTNDDGINSPGLAALVKALEGIATVYVAAPAKQQSATSRHITFIRTVAVEEVELDGAEVAYAVHGHPADCVMWALCKFDRVVDFDFVFSGINMGENTSTATYYSATVAAALEGSMQGIRSIALSVEGHETENFEYICSIIPQLIEFSLKLDSETVLNVNAPDLTADKVRGVRIADIARKDRSPRFHYVSAENGEYQMAVEMPCVEPSITEDFGCLRAGYVSITPLDQRLSAPEALKKLKGNLVEGDLLVIMGAQHKLLEGLHKGLSVEENICMLADCVSRLGTPTVLTELYGEGELLPEVTSFCDNAERFILAEFDALQNSEFSNLAESIASRKVFLAGAETHISVQQTAAAFRKLGFDVSIIEECCTSSSKDEHKAAIENMRAMGCHIITIEAAAMELIGSKTHPAYGSIKNILKQD
ncbi:MAG: 5'/3'-nucleotidase SurE [Clostridiales bacterium]|nr:5'/3'-nucleotidase SurE [Candidatus Crickella caballi]